MGDFFQPGQITIGMFVGLAAHLLRWRQSDADGRAAGVPEKVAAPVRRQLNATVARRFALGQAGDGRGNGDRDTTGGATDTTIHSFTDSTI